MKEYEDAERGEGSGGEGAETGSVGPSVNTEPAYERVRGRRGETEHDKEDGGKEGSRGRKLGTFILQTGFVLIFSLLPSHTHTHTRTHAGEVEKW